MDLRKKKSGQQVMKDPSYCYKFYWLERAVNLLSEYSSLR